LSFVYVSPVDGLSQAIPFVSGSLDTWQKKMSLSGSALVVMSDKKNLMFFPQIPHLAGIVLY